MADRTLPDAVSGRYSLARDLELLRAEGKIVLAYTVTTKGFVTLWYDRQGYTVTYAARGARGVGGARSFEQAADDYHAKLRELI